MLADKYLNDNEETPEIVSPGIQISSSLQDNSFKTKPFRFLKKNSDQTVTKGKFVFYKPAKLVKGKRLWVEYWYRIPQSLQTGKKEWQKFRVFEDINRFKSDEYSRILLAAVNKALENGFNPFEYQQKQFLAKQLQLEEEKEWSCIHAFNYFIQKWEERGNEPGTLTKYKSALKVLTDWLQDRKLQHNSIADIKRKWVELCLSEASTLNKWSNRHYNNKLFLLRTVFNFLIKEGMIKVNPCADIDKKKSLSKKHKYYDEEKFQKIRDLMREHDPLLFFASSLIYYLCIRSEKELKGFKLENIFLDRRQALITAQESKTDSDRMIPIPNALMDEFKRMKEAYPGHYYVIGGIGRQKDVRENKPSAVPFGAGFLSKRFVKIRKLAGLDSNYTLMGLRHTRATHLKLDGASDVDISRLMGHTDFATTSKYLRNIGLQIDDGRINKLSREF